MTSLIKPQDYDISKANIELYGVSPLAGSSLYAYVIQFNSGYNPFNAPIALGKVLPKGGKKNNSVARSREEIYIEELAQMAKEVITKSHNAACLLPEAYREIVISKSKGKIVAGRDLFPNLKEEVYEQIVAEHRNKAIFFYSPNN